MVDEGVVNENPDGTFTFEHDAPTCPPAAPTAAEPSGPRFTIMPPIADLVKELLAYQHTMPSWKAMQREAMGWEGMAEENTKKYVENIGVKSAE